MTAEMYGMNPPFIGGPQNIMSRQEDEQLIKNDILQLLMTIPGERVMRPTFGVNLRNAVFEPSDEGTVSGLELEIRRAIEQYEPRVILDGVQIVTDDQNNGMSIQIYTTLRSDPAKRIDIVQFIGFSNGP
jgi:phage baseplate assembly protein W